MNMSTHDLSNVKANTEKQGKGEITLEKIKLFVNPENEGNTSMKSNLMCVMLALSSKF